MARTNRAKFGLPPGVRCVRVKGREYFYYQPGRGTWQEGPRVALPGCPFAPNGLPDEAWWQAYRKLAGPDAAAEVKTGTFGAMIKDFKASPEFKALSPRTREVWSYYLGRIDTAWGELPVRSIETHHILKLRDRFGATPAAANNLMRALSSMLSWGVPRKWLAGNPCLGLRGLKFKKGIKPYEPWPWSAIETLREVAPQRLWHVAAMALYTGQRQGDVVAMRWSDIEADQIHVEQSKTGKRLQVAIHKDLKAILDVLPRAGAVVLRNEHGDPWTTSALKSAWRRLMKDERCAEIRRRRLVFHGLRKSAVVMLLEAGCTDAEVSAITGQSRDMVEHYARAVNQRKLAAAAILKWEGSGGRDARGGARHGDVREEPEGL